MFVKLKLGVRYGGTGIKELDNFSLNDFAATVGDFLFVRLCVPENRLKWPRAERSYVVKARRLKTVEKTCIFLAEQKYTIW